MQIKLHKNIQYCTSWIPRKWKARPDITERWFDVDTTRIEPGRYYLTDENGNTCIVTDLFVSEIRDDVRRNAIQCKYCAALFCGKTVQEAENAYTAHCDAAEKQCCPVEGPFADCFYRLPKLISDNKETIDIDDQTFETVRRSRFKLCCQYAERCEGEFDGRKNVRCMHQEHRNYPPFYYDENNTPGLAMPKRPEVIDLPDGSPKLFSYRLVKDYGLDCYRLYNQRTTILFLLDPVHDKFWATSDCFASLMQFKSTPYGVDRRLIGKVKEIMHDLYGMKK